MTSNPTPWSVIDREAEGDPPLSRRYTLSWIVDARGEAVQPHTYAESPERRAVMERIVRAVNLVSWLSPETIAKLEELGAEFERMQEAVTA